MNEDVVCVQSADTSACTAWFNVLMKGASYISSSEPYFRAIGLYSLASSSGGVIGIS